MGLAMTMFHCSFFIVVSSLNVSLAVESYDIALVYANYSICTCSDAYHRACVSCITTYTYLEESGTVVTSPVTSWSSTA